MISLSATPKSTAVSLLIVVIGVSLLLPFMFRDAKADERQTFVYRRNIASFAVAENDETELTRVIERGIFRIRVAGGKTYVDEVTEARLAFYFGREIEQDDVGDPLVAHWILDRTGVRSVEEIEIANEFFPYLGKFPFQFFSLPRLSNLQERAFGQSTIEPIRTVGWYSGLSGHWAWKAAKSSEGTTLIKGPIFLRMENPDTAISGSLERIMNERDDISKSSGEILVICHPREIAENVRKMRSTSEHELSIITEATRVLIHDSFYMEEVDPMGEKYSRVPARLRDKL